MEYVSKLITNFTSNTSTSWMDSMTLIILLGLFGLLYVISHELGVISATLLRIEKQRKTQ